MYVYDDDDDADDDDEGLPPPPPSPSPPHGILPRGVPSPPLWGGACGGTLPSPCIPLQALLWLA